MPALCKNCEEKPVHIVKHALCANCYNRALRKGEIRTTKSHRLFDQKKRMCEKYPGIEQDMRALETNPYVTLTEIGERHNVTREYIRQIVPIFLGKDYGTIRREKSEKRNSENNISCKFHPSNRLNIWQQGTNHYRSVVAVDRVIKKCKALGYEVGLNKERSMGLLVNGHTVLVRSSGADWRSCNDPNKKSYMQYNHFTMSEKQQRCADFVVCFSATRDTYYILPKKEIGSKAVYIPLTKSAYSTRKSDMNERLTKYAEAWELLA